MKLAGKSEKPVISSRQVRTTEEKVMKSSMELPPVRVHSQAPGGKQLARQAGHRAEGSEGQPGPARPLNL